MRWRITGEKLGKTPGQIQSDIRRLLLSRAKPTPRLTLTSLDGAKVLLADYRGKVVLVNFWHPTCAACRAESPFLQQTLRKFGARQMAVLSVNVRPAEDGYVLPYIHGNGYYFTPLHDDDAAHDTPATLLIDAEGRLIAERGPIRGVADQRGLELLIETLLSQPKAGPMIAGNRVSTSPDDFHRHHGAAR